MNQDKADSELKTPTRRQYPSETLLAQDIQLQHYGLADLLSLLEDTAPEVIVREVAQPVACSKFSAEHAA